MKDGLPVMDAQGNPLFYDSRCTCKIAFVGGEVETPITMEQYATLQEGNLYLLKGRQGIIKSFGSESVGVVYNVIEEL